LVGRQPEEKHSPRRNRRANANSLLALVGLICGIVLLRLNGGGRRLAAPARLAAPSRLPPQRALQVRGFTRHRLLAEISRG